MAHLLKFASYCKEKGNNKEIERMRKAERQKIVKILLTHSLPTSVSFILDRLMIEPIC